MPRLPRIEQFDPGVVGILHLIQRCVRKSFLAGVDPLSGHDFTFRREWIRARMERLASVFGIDVLTYAILSNHLHIVIRNRPDIVLTWSDRDVALRWLRIFPGRRLDEQLPDPSNKDVEQLANDPERMKVVRARLSDPSWFMRALCEPIARLANKQEEITGHFWEGRFKAIPIKDEAALLACSIYVDLNPIRAAMAETPEKAVHTSAYDRIHALKGETISSSAAVLITLEEAQAKAEEALAKAVPATEAEKEVAANATAKSGSSPGQELLQKSEQLPVRNAGQAVGRVPSQRPVASTKKRRGDRIARDAWLVPLTMDPKAIGEALPSAAGYRASDMGFLGMELRDYLQLLDWTGRQNGVGNKATIPDEMMPILQRLGIESGMWVDLTASYMKYYGKSRSGSSQKVV